ncbi:MAG: universal stress protein [Solirubrobacterales bacterium]|nr:universal stress protein [Solirubrobacterales bacterium]
MPPARDALTFVVGFDGSDAARRGLAYVGELAAEARNVVVVTVTPDLGESSITSETLARDDFDAERLLDEAVALLADTDGTTIERRAATGDPARVLVDVTREVDADLLIVGRRGADFVARTLLGSVAQRVVEQASCDVLVVR